VEIFSTVGWRTAHCEMKWDDSWIDYKSVSITIKAKRKRWIDDKSGSITVKAKKEAFFNIL